MAAELAAEYTATTAEEALNIPSLVHFHRSSQIQILKFHHQAATRLTDAIGHTLVILSFEIGGDQFRSTGLFESLPTGGHLEEQPALTLVRK